MGIHHTCHGHYLDNTLLHPLLSHASPFLFCQFCYTVSFIDTRHCSHTMSMYYPQTHRNAHSLKLLFGILTTPLTSHCIPLSHRHGITGALAIKCSVHHATVHSLSSTLFGILPMPLILHDGLRGLTGLTRAALSSIII